MSAPLKVLFYLAALPEEDMPRRQFPLGAGYLAAWLERELPGRVETRLTASEEDIDAWRPDLLAITAVSQTYAIAREVARRARRDVGMPVVLGGYHVSALPHRLDPVFDAGVIGEGEITFTELVRVLLRTGGLPAAELRGLSGVCFHDDDALQPGVRVNGARGHLDVDALPWPKRNISRGARNIVMFSSRGCAYRCEFCASSRHWGRLRCHSPERVVAELKQLVDVYDATSIHMMDDLFFADRQRVARIADLIEQEGMGGRVTFHALITSNLADEKTFALAKRMGFTSIRFGGETGSDVLLKRMKGNWASVDNHQRCVDLGRRHGIDISASFMLGAPGETLADLDATVAFLRRNHGHFRIDGLYLTTPVPGTPYWNYALERGLVDEEMDWSRLNLDFSKRLSFGFDRCIYLNEDNVPLSTVRQYYEHIRDNFVIVGQEAD